jgi:glycosyltransferase involved in cell wall biosynthesis/predicted O-methyltransferase YrrM
VGVNKKDYYVEMKKIAESIEPDFGGGSSLAKTFVMAYLAIIRDLKTYVEIGVYRGRSLFPVAVAFKINDGMCYGIDPFLLEEAIEYDVEENVGKQITLFLESLKFDDIYIDVLNFRENHDFTRHVELIRETSEDAVAYFKKEAISIDMLHIDGNHDTENVQMDIDNYLPLLNDGAMIVFDDINWPSVHVVYNEVKNKYVRLFESETFGILIKQEKTQTNLRNAELLGVKLEKIYTNVFEEISTEKSEEYTPTIRGGVITYNHEKYITECLEVIVQHLIKPGKTQTNLRNAELPGLKLEKTDTNAPTICVGVITYNHEKYITECLEGIVQQTGAFKLKVVICDDNSSDKTTEIIEKFIDNQLANGKVSFTLIKNHNNMGISENFGQCVYSCAGADYVAFCEGDDYWIAADKLQSQMTFLQDNPQCSICFNNIILYLDEENRFEIFQVQQALQEGIFTTNDLLESYFIGNLSCCFYNARYINAVPKSLFKDLFIVDWMFNIYYSQFGDIGYIKRPLSIYRKHKGGNWSSIPQKEQCQRLIKYIDEYNEYLNFSYDHEFTRQRKILVSLLESYG